MTDEPYEGMWDWDGACDPAKARRYGVSQHTFSVGCFQWVRKARGKGLKRGRVQYRIKGDASDPETVYATARTYCARKNAAGGTL